MKITFLGTRGYIKAKTKAHACHTSTLVTYKKLRLLIDCGLDWLGHIDEIKPDAIIITHAHPDHAWGLKDGAPCPVYATKESWALMKKYPIKYKGLVKPREPFVIGPFLIEAFDLIHSIRCPAVGYRIKAGAVSIFCAHDVLAIHDREEALKEIDLYIGDGASVNVPKVHRRDNQLFGHASIKTQLGWCKKEQVPRAIFTHCGIEIVKGDSKKILSQIKNYDVAKDIDVAIAYDGMMVILR